MVGRVVEGEGDVLGKEEEKSKLAAWRPRFHQIYESGNGVTVLHGYRAMWFAALTFLYKLHSGLCLFDLPFNYIRGTD